MVLLDFITKKKKKYAYFTKITIVLKIVYNVYLNF